ncbi:MAG: hypothetical protein AAFW89_07975 [Bacteroidota bacterium]
MGRSMLLIVSGLVIVTGIVQRGINNRNKLLPERSATYYYELQARNNSRSLVDLAIRKIIEDNSWTGTLNSDQYSQGSVSLTLYDNTNIADYASASSVPLDTIGWNADYSVVLHSISQVAQCTVATTATLRRDSYSVFSYYTDNQPSNIWFMDQDVISGQMHTNGTFRIAGSPVFNGFVSSPNSWVGHSSYTNTPQFNMGSNFSAPTRPTPDNFEISKLQTNASSGGLRYNNFIQVSLLDTLVDIREWTGSNWGSATQYDLRSFNGIISSTRDVYIQGRLDGQLTVHSDDDIQIYGDITYADDPRVNPDSDDILGLIGESEVYVTSNAHSYNGSRDLEIHASIMALSTSFEVSGYNSGSAKGELEILGGIIQDTRGPVATFSGGVVQTGYTKDYQYDLRLQNMAPPFFPRESIFSVQFWKDNMVSSPSCGTI